MKNNIIDNSDSLFSFGTAPKVLMIVLAPILTVIYLSFFLALFFSLGWFFLIALLLVVFYLGWYSCKYAVRRVNFYENQIQVIHFFNYQSYFLYEEVKIMNEVKQGFLPYEVIVAKLKTNKYKKKKFHFFCPQKDRAEFDVFLQKKDLKIKPQP